MPYTRLIRRLVGRTPRHLYECRNCGEPVDADTHECPVCERSDIAVYRL